MAKILFFFALFFFLCSLGAASATTFFVDNTIASCSDSGSGTGESQPFCSIAKAAQVAQAGDVVEIKPGTYHDPAIVAHSGTAGAPIVFRKFGSGNVILGEVGASLPSSDAPAYGAMIVLLNVNYITFEGITVKNSRGWVIGRSTSHITFNNCSFIDGWNDCKGSVKAIESSYWRITNSYFENGCDSVQFVKTDRSLVENNDFDTARHALFAVRCGNYNIFRNNNFENPNTDPVEKHGEVYDCKTETGVWPHTFVGPSYNNTKYNLFEDNFFGFHPRTTNFTGAASALQYSGQNGIIRNNVFSNPTGGGTGLGLRLGGSADQGIEARYVTGNKAYNNTFYANDNGGAAIPLDYVDSPPWHVMPDFAFSGNVFKNNIFSHGIFVKNRNWAVQDFLQGRPVQFYMGKLWGFFAEKNDYFSPLTGQYAHQLIFRSNPDNDPPFEQPQSPGWWDSSQPSYFLQSLELDPLYQNASGNDFHLQASSPLIDQGAFLTRTTSAGSGTTMAVQDAGYFFDGFGITGETPDTIRLQGQTATAGISSVNYATNTITLTNSLSWGSGVGVSLVYNGNAPDIGAFESSGSGPVTCPQGLVAFACNCGDTACNPGSYCCGTTCQATACTTPCSMAQLMAYIAQWKSGTISMATIIDKISKWKAGTPC